MTAAQLIELERVLITAAVAGAVTAWSVHRLESLSEAGDSDTAIVIARITKRIAAEIIKQTDGV